MKHLLLALVMVSVAMGQVSKTSPVKKPAVPAKSVARDETVTARRETFSYALGITLGAALKIKSMDVDLDTLSQGLKDAMSGGKTRMTQEEAKSVLEEVQTEQSKTQQAAIEKPPEKSTNLGDNGLAVDNDVPEHHFTVIKVLQNNGEFRVIVKIYPELGSDSSGH